MEDFRAVDFDERELTCPKCGWQGKGDEAHIIDFYGVSKVQEVHCPNCDRLIANLRKEPRSPGPF
ncbi:MAG TPA: hypothetical protein VHK69_00760 [Chitinophagaceae bacterium]|jgi:predicted RNA-binding Zn-ribbon protein involved in translation (DUF1610 family)|nr:hypothetical protein [Chitinophagaceae bacterium]